MKSKDKSAGLLTLGIQAVFIRVLFTYMDGRHGRLSVEHSWPNPHVWRAQKLGVTRNTFKLNHRTFYWNGISTAWTAVTCGLWPSPAAAVETNVNTLTGSWWQKCLDGLRSGLEKTVVYTSAVPAAVLRQEGCSSPPRLSVSYFISNSTLDQRKWHWCPLCFVVTLLCSPCPWGSSSAVWPSPSSAPVVPPGEKHHGFSPCPPCSGDHPKNLHFI